MAKLLPYHNNIVVEEFQLGEVSRGGLLIPQIAKASTPYRFAKVIAVGPGRYAGDGTLVPCSSKPGDVVAFAKNAGVEFPLDDADGNEQVFRLVNEQYLLGAVEGLPERSLLTGIDGQLLRMQPGSRAPADGAVEHQDRINRAVREGFIDTQGNTLDLMNEMDASEEPS